MLTQAQYRLNAADLEIVLAMMRMGTLVAAGERLGVGTSTVFRFLQCIERGLGVTPFARSHTGYLTEDLAHALVEQVEQVESALKAARSAVHTVPDQVLGTVYITITGTILVGLVAPALKALQAQHPYLRYDLRVSNELANLTRHDSDIAVRTMHHPPQHLMGRRIGSIRVGLYARRASGITYVDVETGCTPWVVVDDTVPDHPSVG